MTNDNKVFMSLTLVNVKRTQISLHKTITCERGNQHRKLETPIKTRFVNKVIMFDETMEFKQVILLCYGKEKT